MAPERPPYTLRYAGGNSRPHETQDTSDGWKRFFTAQELVASEHDQGVIKTSEISPLGMMWVHAKPLPYRDCAYITDMNWMEACEHFALVGSTLQIMRDMYPNAPLVLTSFNASETPSIDHPRQLSQPPQDRTVINSQSLKVFHSHCDVIEDVGAPLPSLFTAAILHETHLRERYNLPTGPLPESVQKELELWLEMRKLQYHKPFFEELMHEHWNHDISPTLLSSYPEVFAPPTLQLPEGAPTPHTAFLRLRHGFDSMAHPHFGVALRFLHEEIVDRWARTRQVLLDTRDTGVPEVAQAYRHFYPWVSDRLIRHIQGVSALIQDRRPDATPMEKRRWLHTDFNYTMGVAHYQGNEPHMYVGIDPNSGGGIQSLGIISIRDNHPLSPQEIRTRTDFRLRLTRTLLERHPQLTLGTEGRHLFDDTSSL